MLRRNDARGEPLPEHRVGVPEIRLPEKTVLLQQWIFSRHAVDDDVEAVVGAEDPAEQRSDLALARVIDAHGDRGAVRGLHQRRGLVDGLRPPVRRRLAGDAAARAVDRRAGFGERASDAAAGAAGRPRDEGDASAQRLARVCFLCHRRPGVR